MVNYMMIFLLSIFDSVNAIKKVWQRDYKWIHINLDIEEDIVYEIINEEYGSEKSALMHYEYDKKRKKLFLYSIGNGERIQFLCEDLNEVIIFWYIYHIYHS